MSQSFFGNGSTAVTNNQRSGNNLGAASTYDNKSNGNPMASTFAPARGGWASSNSSSNIWSNGTFSNGFNSRGTTRDSSRARDTRPSSSDEEVIEGKTGSGSLVDSSVSEDSDWRSAWVAKRGLPSTRSMSQAQYPADASTFQQRSVSNAGLPASFSSASQNSAPFTSRQQATNLNAASTTHARPAATSPYALGYPGRGSEQPPNVYTKFDRPSEPRTRKADSAKEGSWNEYSPTDERKLSFAGPFGSRNASTPVSRDGSIHSSYQSEEHPLFTRPDYSRVSQRQTQNNSRAPSISSQGNSTANPWLSAHVHQLERQLEQINLNGSSRPRTSQRPSVGSSAMFSQPSPVSTVSPFSRSALATHGPVNESEHFDQFDTNYAHSGSYITPQQAAAYSEYLQNEYGGRNSQTPSATELMQHPHFPNGILSPHLLDMQNGTRPAPSWASIPEVGSATRRLPSAQETGPYYEFRIPPHLLAPHLRAAYQPTFNPYALQLNGANSYLPYLPLNASPIDASGEYRDMASRTGEGMQSLLLFEFKTKQAKHYELKDIYDHIAEFSGDQHGSRFIQTKLETANSDEKQRVFDEIEPNAIQLMTDVFGNYVIQKFFEHGDQKHKKILASKMKGEVLNLSLQMYGCRVVQKALDHVLVDQQHELVSELEGQVIKCVKDQNGNHVIQKAIERCRPQTIAFIIKAFLGEVQSLSVHPYGCRVIQRCLERCEPEAKRLIMIELVQCMSGLIGDQYGNYVVQHVVQHDEGEGRRIVMNIVERNLENHSKHKFASNVVEKCLEKSDDEFRHKVVCILANGNPQQGEGQGVFVSMIKDNYGNYVIQKLLDTLAPDDYCEFVNILQPNLTMAKRTGCGKQVQSIEKKMNKFTPFRGGSTNGSYYNTHNHRIPLPPAFAHQGSPMETPQLTPGTQGLKSNNISGNANSDAVEGATIDSRRGSEHAPTEGYFHH